MRASRFPRNDVWQYDDLVAEWWEQYGALAILRWLAAAWAAHPPWATALGAALLDIGCGVAARAARSRLGYRHVGVDLSEAGLGVARRQGALPVRATVRLPLPDGWPTR